MARKRKQNGDSDSTPLFEKISLLGDLTQAVNNKDLRDAFQAIGQNGDRLFEIFIEGVMEEIEFLMKGEQEEVPQVMSDAAQSASQVYGSMTNLYAMMMSLSNSPAMQALSLISQRIGGPDFNPQYQQPQYEQPQYQQPAPQQYRQPQQQQLPPQQPQQHYAPPPQQQAPAPKPQAPQQRPARSGRYAGEDQPAPQQQQAPQPPRKAPIKGHTDPAPTLPPRRNSISGLF